MKTNKLIALVLMIAAMVFSSCSKDGNEIEPQQIPTVTKMIDLHLHLDGAISLSSARQLAKMQGISIPESDAELTKLMRVSPDCKDLNEFLEKFDFPCSLMQTKEGITTAVYNLCEELRSNNIIYAEIRFAPQKSCDKGLTQEEVVLAALEGLKKSEMRANLILCCMRGEINEANNAMNRETVRLTQKYLGKGVCSTDLAGAEALFPTETFKDIFAYARELDVPFEIHAGEAAGPQSVRQALALGAKRIGHGVRSVEDPSLVTELAAMKMPLLVCPTSNVQTCIVQEVKGLPIRTFLNAGIPFTISTDDPAVEGTDLKTEWEKVITAFSLSKAEVRQLMLNAVNAAFCSDDLRQQLKQEMEEAYK